MLRKRLAGMAVLLLTLAVVSAATAGPPQASSSSSSQRLRVPSGEKVVLELETAFNTATARPGDRALFRTVRDIMVSGKTAIPKGSLIGGTITRVRTAQSSSRAEMEFRLDTFKFDDGTEIPLTTENIKMKADDSGRGTKTVLNGVITQGLGQAAQGAVLGGLFGGRKAAGIGAALGIGATLLGQTVLQPRVPGPELDLASGTVFEARLKKPVDVPVRVASLPPATRSTSGGLASGGGNSPGAGGLSPDGGFSPVAGVLSPNDPSFPEGPTRENAGSRNDTQPDQIARGDSRPDPFGGPRTITIPSPLDPAVPVPVFNDTPVAVATGPANGDPATLPGAPADVPADSTASFKLSVNVNLAQVDALVRDRGGRPINNLTMADFRLFENGVERPIETFSKDSLPLAVALVIDRSGSVAPFMNRIQTAAYEAISQLKPGDAVCLFSFAGNVEFLEPLTTDRQRVANRIGSISAGGGTNIVDALYEAMSYLEEAAHNQRRAVILISDNVDMNGDRSVAQAIDLAHRSETVVYSVKIDTTGFALPSVFPTIPGPFSVGRSTVPEITRESGGEIFDVSSSGSIDRAMATAVGRLKTRYTLGYSPASEEARASRRIEIRLVDRFGKANSDYTVHAQSAAYSSSAPSDNRRRR